MTIGHNTNIYSSRYVSPANALLTTLATNEQRPDGSIIPVLYVWAGANVSTGLIATAPCDGRIVGVDVGAGFTSTDDNSLTYVLLNGSTNLEFVNTLSNSNTHVLTINTNTSLTLDTTAANVVVNAGDRIVASLTETNTTAASGITFYIQPD